MWNIVRSGSGHEKKGNLICFLHMQFLQTYGKPDSSKSTVDCSRANKTCRGEDGECTSFCMLHRAFRGEISSVIDGFSFQSWLWCCALWAQSSQTWALLRPVPLLQHSISAGLSRLFCCRGGNPTGEERAAAWRLSAVPLPGSAAVRVGRSSSAVQANPCRWHVLVAPLTCAALLSPRPAHRQGQHSRARVAGSRDHSPSALTPPQAGGVRREAGESVPIRLMLWLRPASRLWVDSAEKTPFVGCCLFMYTQDPHRPPWTREAFHTEAFGTKLDSFSFCGYHLAFMINIGDKI